MDLPAVLFEHRDRSRLQAWQDFRVLIISHQGIPSLLVEIGREKKNTYQAVPTTVWQSLVVSWRVGDVLWGETLVYTYKGLASHTYWAIFQNLHDTDFFWKVLLPPILTGQFSYTYMTLISFPWPFLVNNVWLDQPLLKVSSCWKQNSEIPKVSKYSHRPTDSSPPVLHFQYSLRILHTILGKS